MKEKTKKPSNFSKHTLSPLQALRLSDLIEGYPGGTTAFARAVCKFERELPKVPKDATVTAAQLRQIIARHRGLSTRRRWACAKVLKCKTEVLQALLDAPSDSIVLSRALLPWFVGEDVLSKYRAVYHHYHLTRMDDDKYFWVYTYIDFKQQAQSGFLYAPIRYGVHGDGDYIAFGYVLRHMLVLMFRTDESPEEMESVHLYPYFRKAPFGRVGNFGVLWNQNPDGTKGLGGSLLFTAPFPGTSSPGEQEPDVCANLSKYWRIMNAPRCNRILRLCDRALLDREEAGASRLEAILDGDASPIGK